MSSTNIETDGVPQRLNHLLTSRRLGRIAFCIAWMTCCSTACAIDIEQTIWGFDGRIVPYRFNPVSLLVSNTTEEPAAILLELRQTDGASGDRIGAKLQEEVFLSPFSSRWVQFYPYITLGAYEWRAVWGFLPSQSKDLPSPNVGGPARVALTAAGNLSAQRTKAKTFPEELFPPFVSATSTLEGVFLDHNPRWQETRRKSLLHWVQRGGTVFVTPDSSGKFPEFTGELALWNQPLPEIQVGQGQVVRCETHEDAAAEANKRLGKPFTSRFSSEAWERGETMLFDLRSITRPEHNWWVIHLMSLIYVGLVFPGWYLLAKTAKHYRTTILAFLGASFIFTTAFNMVGRRGYGESTTVNTLALAKKVDGDLFDVTSWTNIFVTGGDNYELKYEAEGSLFSTPYAHTQVAGVIDNGTEGKFFADIPLFSSRTFLHQGGMKAVDWQIEILGDEPENGGGALSIEEMRLSITPHPDPDSVIYAIVGESLYTVSRVEDYYRVRPTNETYLARMTSSQDQYYQYGYRRRPSADANHVYRSLVSKSLGLAMERDVYFDRGSSLPDDKMRILIADKLPETFSVRHPQLEAAEGRIVYSLDVRLGEHWERPTPSHADEELDDDDEDYDQELDEELGQAQSVVEQLEEDEPEEEPSDEGPSAEQPREMELIDEIEASLEVDGNIIEELKEPLADE